jgi:hypothetical protein
VQGRISTRQLNGAPVAQPDATSRLTDRLGSVRWLAEGNRTITWKLRGVSLSRT